MSNPKHHQGVGDNTSRSHALALAGLGYKIVPLPPREKFPKGLSEWQKKATCDVLQIQRWLDKSPDMGIGWAMGAQPNGRNLAGIDVDVANGKQGWTSLRSLDVRFNIRDLVRNTITTVTGSGGRHLIVDTGPLLVTNGLLGPGLDLRGEGGFLVAPPSIHPNGESYRWVEGKAPWEIDPFLVDEGFGRFLLNREGETPEPPGHGRTRVTTQALSGVEVHRHDDLTPADFARQTMRIPDLLIEGGWQYKETRGNDTYWTRPGKNMREGHSAVLHDDAPLVVWSTSAPAAFWRAGKDARDGSRVLSPFEVFAAVRHSGDVAAAGRALRKEMTPPSVVSRETAPPPAPTPTSPTADLNLPDEFWEARPILGHIRAAAHSRLVSPDAALLGVLARYAVLVPASYRIPAMVGSESTFDFIGCSVASSSGGKSVANHVAKDLLPIERKDLLVDLPVGSGEGLIQSFLVPEIDPATNKPTGKQVIGINGIHFTVDEGTALMEQQARKGTTIVQTLCSAWSGATLGQANASIETRRIIDAMRVRVSAVINIQTANGHLLLDERMIAVGLPQRIVFAHAHAPLPDLDAIPDWPGRIDVWNPPIIQSNTTALAFDRQIVQEVRAQRHAVASGSTVLGPVDGHLTLVRAKLAGLLALIGGSLAVNGDDWGLAGMIVDSSVAVRRLLIEAKVNADRERVATMGVAQASRELAAEDFKERQAIATLSDRLVAKVPAEGIGRNVLRKATCASHTKHRFEPALDMAIARGALKVSDGLVLPV